MTPLTGFSLAVYAPASVVLGWLVLGDSPFLQAAREISSAALSRIAAIRFMENIPFCLYVCPPVR